MEAGDLRGSDISGLQADAVAGYPANVGSARHEDRQRGIIHRSVGAEGRDTPDAGRGSPAYDGGDPSLSEPVEMMAVQV
jgi:hypothetical protein